MYLVRVRQRKVRFAAVKTGDHQAEHQRESGTKRVNRAVRTRCSLIRFMVKRGLRVRQKQWI